MGLVKVIAVVPNAENIAACLAMAVESGAAVRCNRAGAARRYESLDVATRYIGIDIGIGINFCMGHCNSPPQRGPGS